MKEQDFHTIHPRVQDVTVGVEPSLYEVLTAYYMMKNKAFTSGDAKFMARFYVEEWIKEFEKRGVQ